ncbi:hypothetical protein KBI52_21045 [Microvirga sp. HBU67558]|uniref:hypothetical protein n=1 Tax=Microvirga TaxID=186650 RepID=UPI001B372038|nr:MULTISPECIES: hypothetical protein [unclassified Microvirga]MBQ0822677.1 hypothetical protein [Microvirga sp. HBU67558]
MLSRFILSAAVLTLTLPGAHGQSALVTPDWSDPAASRYLEKRNSGALPPSPLEEGLAEPSPQFSLPVLGLREGFAAAEPGLDPAGGFIDPLSMAPDVEWWPKCAATNAKPDFAADPNGTWYSATFNFGCITVVVAGDRNSDSQVPAELRDELSERRGDVASPLDEDDDPDSVLSVTYEIVRFNVPYVVTIECTKESASFCRNRSAHQVLLARLSILQGDPRP